MRCNSVRGNVGLYLGTIFNSCVCEYTLAYLNRKNTLINKLYWYPIHAEKKNYTVPEVSHKEIEADKLKSSFQRYTKSSPRQVK